MKHDHLDWYLLVDGTHASPKDVSKGSDGVLCNKSGTAVALHEDGSPQTVGGGAVENMNVEAAKIGEAEPAPVEPVAEKDMKPEPDSDDSASDSKAK